MARLKDNSGMTMIEVIVTLVILAIIAAATVPSLSGFVDAANAKDCQAKCRDIKKAYVAAMAEAGEDNPQYTKNETILKEVMAKKGATFQQKENISGRDVYEFTGLCPTGGTYNITFVYDQIKVECSHENHRTGEPDPTATAVPGSDSPSTDPGTTVTLKSLKLSKDGLTYPQDATFNPNDLSYTAVYSDGSEIPNLKASDISFNPAPSTSSIGTYLISASYQTVSSNFTLNVVEPQVTGFTISTLPTKTTYNYKDSLQTGGGKLTLQLNNGKTKEVDLDAAWCTPAALTVSGENIPITVTYPGVLQTQSFTVTVNKVLSSIFVKPPTKTAYFVGDTDLDLTGSTFTPKYDDDTITGTEQEITQEMCTGFNTEKALDNEAITVSYSEGGVTKTGTFNIAVKPVELESISIGTSPTSEFYQGDAFNVNGGYLTLTYNNGSTSSLNMETAYANHLLTCEGYTLDKTGQVYQTVTVTYEGKTTNYPIKFYKITGIKVSDDENEMPPNLFVKGESTFNVNGGVLIVSFDDNTTKKVDMTESMIPSPPNIENSQAGSQTVTVEYEGFKAYYKITISESGMDPSYIVYISIYKYPTKLSYYQGDDFSAEGGVLRVVYCKWQRIGLLYLPVYSVSYIPLTVDMCSGYDMSKIDTQKVVVHIDGSPTYWPYSSLNYEDFYIDVKETDLTTLTISNNPTQTFYKGQTFDVNNGKLKATYSDGHTEFVDMTTAMCKDITNGTAKDIVMTSTGAKTIQVTYHGMSVKYTITVNNTVQSITIKSYPTERFSQNGTFNVTGGIITAKDTSNKTWTVPMTSSEVTCTGQDMSTLGKQTVTVSYGGKSTTYQIIVAPINPNVGTEADSAEGISQARINDIQNITFVFSMLYQGTSGNFNNHSYNFNGMYEKSTGNNRAVALLNSGLLDDHELAFLNSVHWYTGVASNNIRFYFTLKNYAAGTSDIIAFKSKYDNNGYFYQTNDIYNKNHYDITTKKMKNGGYDYIGSNGIIVDGIYGAGSNWGYYKSMNGNQDDFVFSDWTDDISSDSPSFLSVSGSQYYKK